MIGMDFDKVFKEITCGNQAAFDFCNSFFRWVHMLDDLVDRDKEVPAGAVSFLSYSLFHTLACNEFFQQHKASLLPVMLISSQAWADSESWKKRTDVLHRITSQVLKSAYQEVFLMVAALCGGIAHMQKISETYRDYNYDQN